MIEPVAGQAAVRERWVVFVAPRRAAVDHNEPTGRPFEASIQRHTQSQQTVPKHKGRYRYESPSRL